MSSKKKINFDISGSEHSTLRGTIGETIALQFLAKKFNMPKHLIDEKLLVRPWLIETFNLTSYDIDSIGRYDVRSNKLSYLSRLLDEFSRSRYINRHELKNKLFNEDQKKLVEFFDKVYRKLEYRPDFIIAIEGKAHFIEVKTSKIKSVRGFQRESLEKIKKSGYNVMIVYIDINSIRECDITIEKI